jgi:HlyD family secretion protein
MLQAVFFDESDKVEAGELAASMDTAVIEKQLDVARVSIEAAQTHLDAAMLGYDQTVEQLETAVELAGNMKEEMLLYNHYIYYDEPFTVTDSTGNNTQVTKSENEGSQKITSKTLGDQKVESSGTAESRTSGTSDSTSISRAGTAQKQSVRVQLQDALNQYELAVLRLEQAKENDLTIRMAEDNLKIAGAQLALYEEQLKLLEIISPIEGIVINRFAQPGEYLLPGAKVLEIGDLSQVTCDIYIPEDRYGKVFLGQEVVLTVDSYPGDEFKGIISKIADEAEFTPKNIQTKDDRVTTVYRITISIDNFNMKLKAGMPADVVINTGDIDF